MYISDRVMHTDYKKSAIVSSQIFKWKMALLDQRAEVFKNRSSGKTDDQVIVDKQHATIGWLTVETDFLEKCLGLSR